MKKKLTLVMFLLMAMPFAAGFAWADYHGKGYGQGQCSVTGGGCAQGDCCGKSGSCPIVEKFMKKAHFFLENHAEIGLSDDQVSMIKSMKMDMKKNMIRNRAEKEIFMIDMKSKLKEPALDVDGINAMIDQSMASMATGAKGSVAALAALKGVLTESQMTKAIEIWKKNS